MGFWLSGKSAMGITFKWMATLTLLLISSVPLLGVANASLSSVAAPSSTPTVAPIARPNPKDAVTFARWLVGQATWGVVSTISLRLNGTPWGNVQSFADGFPRNGTGTPYFYLSPLDATPNDVLHDARASFTISEETVGTCRDDPEMPDCAKTTLSGNLTQLADNQPEAIFAKAALIAKHPIFQHLPNDHKFKVFKLILNDIWLVDYFGGANYITPVEYYRNIRS